MLAVGSLAVAAVGAWFWWTNLSRGRLIADTPTSRIRSAAQGYVELCGSGHWLPGDQIRAPLTGRQCVWWSYCIEERRGSGKNARWVTIDKDRSEELFELQDDTGEVVVDPAGARVISGHSDRWRGPTARPMGPPGGGWSFGGRYRYREQRLHLGDHLYALGWFRSETAEAQSFDRKQAVGEWLRDLKADRGRLLRQFDADGDGQIDMQEWELARAAAEEAVARQMLEHSLAPGVHVFCQPPNGLPYLLSSLPEAELLKRKRWRTGAGLTAALLGSCLGLYTLMLRGWIGL